MLAYRSRTDPYRYTSHSSRIQDCSSPVVLRRTSSSQNLLCPVTMHPRNLWEHASFPQDPGHMDRLCCCQAQTWVTIPFQPTICTWASNSVNTYKEKDPDLREGLWQAGTDYIKEDMVTGGLSPPDLVLQPQHSPRDRFRTSWQARWEGCCSTSSNMGRAPPSWDSCQ